MARESNSTWSTGDGPSGWPQGAPSQRDRLPRRGVATQRKYARIDPLGWDRSKPELEAEAKSVLARAGVDESWYYGFQAVRERGSIIGLSFKIPEQLLEAKRIIKAAEIKVEGCDKCVWLDAEKSHTELKPARNVHRWDR